jgi:hypothetical protein
MPGSAVAGQSGNGERDWSALIEQAEQHTLRLDELASGVGSDQDPSRDLAARLSKIHNFLGDVLVLVDEVRGRIGQDADSGSELTGSLDTLSGSIRTARDAIDDFKVTLDNELIQRASENERHDYRPNKRFREDQQELRSLARAAERTLTDVRGHMDDLLGWLTDL